MSIEALLPRIDDRQFEDIIAEARTRIPRYTPEWTDFNDNDPGIAVVQLLGWMTDLLIYRLGKVPEQNYLKFLQLIGIELQPAEPATAEITFPVVPAFTDPYVIVPARTQVSAEGTPPIVFETIRSLIALRAQLTAVVSDDGYSLVEATSDNLQADQPFYPFGKLAVANSALMLGFDATSPLPPQIDLEIAFFVASEGSSASVFNCSLPESQLYPPVQITWEYWNGTEWKSLVLLKDETNAFLRSGHVHVKLPAKGLMAALAVAGLAPLFWIRARLRKAGYEQAPQLQAIRTNTTVARQAQTVLDEVLGGSNGEPNQVMQLSDAPVLASTLRIEVDEGDGFAEWTEVPDFFSSGPKSRVYRLDRTSGFVLFGDGDNGAIPAINVNNRGASIVARTYQYGGGLRTNVGPGTLTTVLASIDGIDDQGVTNLLAAYGGRDEETLDGAKRRAPAALKSRCRAVTADDFEYLARQAANIRRAYTMPSVHPSFPGIKVPGAVTVVVVPENDSPAPTPSEGTIRTVCAYLNQRKLVTTELFVVRPTYMLVCVTASLIVENDADLGVTRDAIEQDLIAYFHPLRGGEQGDGWPFGGDVFYSRVFQRMLAVPGAQRIESMTITLDGTEYPACTDVTVPDGVLLYSTAHDIQVQYDFGDQ